MIKFIQWIKDELSFIHASLIKYNEYVPLLVSVLVFWFSPYLLRILDPQAGVYDAGILQLPITAIISYGIFQVVVWMTMRVNWLSIRQYFENGFINDFNRLTAWQKITVSLSIYFLSLYALVLLCHAAAGALVPAAK